MQMRRPAKDAQFIFSNLEKDPHPAPPIEEESVMVQYNWSQFFQQSLAFSKSLVFCGIKERSCITIQGFNSPEHFMAIMGTICANCIFSD